MFECRPFCEWATIVAARAAEVGPAASTKGASKHHKSPLLPGCQGLVGNPRAEQLGSLARESERPAAFISGYSIHSEIYDGRVRSTGLTVGGPERLVMLPHRTAIGVCRGLAVVALPDRYRTGRRACALRIATSGGCFLKCRRAMHGWCNWAELPASSLVRRRVLFAALPPFCHTRIHLTWHPALIIGVTGIAVLLGEDAGSQHASHGKLRNAIPRCIPIHALCNRQDVGAEVVLAWGGTGVLPWCSIQVNKGWGGAPLT